MKKPNIVMLDSNSIGPQITWLRPRFDHDWEDYERTTPEQTVERLQGANYAITNKVGINREMLTKNPDLKLIVVAATGCDRVDLKSCLDYGIAVANARDYAGQSVAEHVLALMLALRRSIVAYRKLVIDGSWTASGLFTTFDYPVAELAGCSLGIVGAGSTGKAVGKLAQAFDMKVNFSGRKHSADKVAAPKVERTPWRDVLAGSDIITLHVPLNEDTCHMIGSHELELMTKKPIIINTARGGLIDESALAKAIESGQVSGAGLDVLSSEPITDQSPLWKLREYPSVVITPHIAWSSLAARQALWNQVIGNIEGFHHGKSFNKVV